MVFSKSQATLYIFQQLLEKGSIKRSEVISVLSVSDVSFRRYIQELRAYFVNFNEPYEIEYFKPKDLYQLKNIDVSKNDTDNK